MSPLNHLHDLQRKSSAASLAGKKGGMALWDGRPCCPLAPGQESPGPGNPPSERRRSTGGDAPPLATQVPTGSGSQGRGLRNSFQGGKGDPARPPPWLTGARAPASLGSLLPRHDARWERASDPDADANQETVQGSGGGWGALG